MEPDPAMESNGNSLFPRVAPRVPDAPLLDNVVAKLREIERRSGLDRTLAIGALVLNAFFGGDASVWRDRRRNKNNSIRRLANRKDCPFCKSAHNDAVGVYVAVCALPRIRTYGHITSSHVAAVLTLTGPERELALATAENECWSVRKLRDQVIRARREAGERRGRPAANAQEQVVARLVHAVAELETAGEQLFRLVELEPATVSAIERLCDRIVAVRTNLHQRLRPHSGKVVPLRPSHESAMGLEERTACACPEERTCRV